jgi:hypothetical protein
VSVPKGAMLLCYSKDHIFMEYNESLVYSDYSVTILASNQLASIEVYTKQRLMFQALISSTYFKLDVSFLHTYDFDGNYTIRVKTNASSIAKEYPVFVSESNN